MTIRTELKTPEQEKIYEDGFLAGQEQLIKSSVHRAVNRMAQPEQEPVAWPCLIDRADFSANTITLVMQCEDYKVSARKHWLSITPPQRTWVGLTDEVITKVVDSMPKGINGWMSDWDLYEYARAIEAKLKEKNFARGQA